MIVGLCHGTFDFFHYGHLLHFEEAASRCDYLVVSVTSDKYVNKGGGRPIFTEQQRAKIIKHCEFVNEVLISESFSGVEVIERVCPDFYFKGKDYLNFEDPTGRLSDEIKAVERVGGSVVYTTTTKFSSTAVMRKLGLA